MQSMNTGCQPLICGTCAACCQGPGRVLCITEPAFMYDTYTHDGQTYLSNKPNGDCIYLTPNGCSIYAHRPEVCRKYDCRDYATNPQQALRIRLQGARRLGYEVG